MGSSASHPQRVKRKNHKRYEAESPSTPQSAKADIPRSPAKGPAHSKAFEAEAQKAREYHQAHCTDGDLLEAHRIQDVVNFDSHKKKHVVANDAHAHNSRYLNGKVSDITANVPAHLFCTVCGVEVLNRDSEVLFFFCLRCKRADSKFRMCVDCYNIGAFATGHRIEAVKARTSGTIGGLVQPAVGRTLSKRSQGSSNSSGLGMGKTQSLRSTASDKDAHNAFNDALESNMSMKTLALADSAELPMGKTSSLRSTASKDSADLPVGKTLSLNSTDSDGSAEMKVRKTRSRESRGAKKPVVLTTDSLPSTAATSLDDPGMSPMSNRSGQGQLLLLPGQMPQEALAAGLPPSGRWEGTATEDHLPRWMSRNLTFEASGRVVGSGADSEQCTLQGTWRHKKVSWTEAHEWGVSKVSVTISAEKQAAKSDSRQPSKDSRQPSKDSMAHSRSPNPSVPNSPAITPRSNLSTPRSVASRFSREVSGPQEQWICGTFEASDGGKGYLELKFAGRVEANSTSNDLSATWPPTRPQRHMAPLVSGMVC